MKRLFFLIACLAVTACVGGSGVSARVISTLNTIGTGEQRVLVELRDGDGALMSLDNIPNATLRDENGSPVGVYPGELVWVVPETQPAYSFTVEIPEAETYQLTIDTGGEQGETPPAGLVSVDETIQVGAGETAPPIDGESLTGPELVVFASLERCPSESCQPMIDQVKSVAAESGLDWRVVEVFLNPEVVDVQDLEFSPVVGEWGLPSQPWLYAIDGSGNVAALFEGAVSDRELVEAVDAITLG